LANTTQCRSKQKKNSWIHAAISTQYWLVDNGQLESHGIYRASIVLRGISEAKVKHTTICKCQTVYQQQAAAVATHTTSVHAHFCSIQLHLASGFNIENKKVKNKK